MYTYPAYFGTCLERCALGVMDQQKSERPVARLGGRLRIRRVSRSRVLQVVEARKTRNADKEALGE